MAFDGVTIANIVSELKDKLIGNRVYKIAQPEKDELLFDDKRELRTNPNAHVGRCFPSSVVFNTEK